MRKTKMAVLGMMMVLSMTACAGKAEQKSIGAETTVQETAAETVENDGKESKEVVGMTNPFTDHDTLKEAEEAAGFQLRTPDEINGVKAAAFRNLDQELLEVIYLDGETEMARVRKGTGNEDISGDYNEYSDVKDVDVNGKTVTIKGTADGYVLAVWNDGGYAYAVSVEKPLSQEELTGLVEQVQ